MLLILVLLSTFSLYSQQNGYDEKVTIVKAYTPIINDAHKINTAPVIDDTTVAKPALTYSISPQKLQTTIEVKPMKAARMSGVKERELQHLYLKTGFGNYITPYFEVFYNSLRSKKYMYGIHFRHLSSSGTINDYAYSGYSENSFDVDYTLFTRNHLVKTDVMYDRQVVHYYGRPEGMKNDTLDKNDIKQRFQTMGVSLGLLSNYSRSNKLNHYATMRYRHFNDIKKNNEHHATLTAGMNHKVSWLNIVKDQHAGLDAAVNYYNTKWVSDSNDIKLNNALIDITPWFNGKINDLTFRIGGVINIETEKETNNNTLHFFPDIHAKITIKERKFIIHAGVTGSNKRNAYSTLAAENPFIVNAPELHNQLNKIRVFGGVTTQITKQLNFNAQVSSISFENMPFFVADTSELFDNRFIPLYDEGSYLHVKGELGYQFGEKFTLLAGGHLYNYNLSTLKSAWHKPGYKVSLTANYTIQSTIILDASINYLGDINVRTYETGGIVTDRLDNILDINLSLEYRLRDYLSGFLSINNLTASKYYRWQYYPSQRFNVLLGITYAI